MADYKKATEIIRETITKELGSPPGVMPPSHASGLIVFQWNGFACKTESEILQSIGMSIKESQIGKWSSTTTTTSRTADTPSSDNQQPRPRPERRYEQDIRRSRSKTKLVVIVLLAIFAGYFIAYGVPPVLIDQFNEIQSNDTIASLRETIEGLLASLTQSMQNVAVQTSTTKITTGQTTNITTTKTTQPKTTQTSTTSSTTKLTTTSTKTTTSQAPLLPGLPPSKPTINITALETEIHNLIIPARISSLTGPKRGILHRRVQALPFG